MKLESQRYGSLVESYHSNIRDRTGQKSKVKKERHDVNITVTNRELPSSRWNARCVIATTLWSTSIFLSASLIHQIIAIYFFYLYKGLNGEIWCILVLMWKLNTLLYIYIYIRSSLNIYIYIYTCSACNKRLNILVSHLFPCGRDVVNYTNFFYLFTNSVLHR